MQSNIEKEYAVALTKQQYEKLTKAFDYNCRIQTNYYYASHRNDVGIRVRSVNGQNIFTLKKEENGHTIEHELLVDEVSLNHPEIQKLLQKFNVTEPFLIGKMQTTRMTYLTDEGELALDKSDYLGISDYEIEYELFDDKVGNNDFLLNLLKENDIPYIENEITKYARFINYRNSLKVAILCADGNEECEALMTYDLLKRAGIKTHLLACQDSLKITSTHGLEYFSDKKISDCNSQDYVAIILPGGLPGADNLAKHPTVNQWINEFIIDTKLICAICAAPKILIDKGLLKSQEFAVFPGFEGNLKASDKPVFQKDNLITARSLG